MDSVRNDVATRPPGPGCRPAGEHRRPIALLLWTIALILLVAGGLFSWDWYRAHRVWSEAGAALARHDPAAALPLLERYLQLRPHDAEGWFLAARTARRQGQFGDAERYLAECEKLGGHSDAIRLERDLAIVQRGELGEVDTHLRATIEPNHPDVGFVLEALARGYLTADRLADAREACELWQKVEPSHPWPWLWLGWISERMTQWDQATALYRQALELVPDSRDARVSLGRALLRKRLPNEAVEHFEWVLARMPEDSAAELGLGECRLEQGQAEEAAKLISRALEREPASAAALYLRGKAASVLGDAAGAESWLRRSLELQPGTPEALHLLIVSLRAQGKEGEADKLAPRLEELRKDLQRLSELLRVIGPRLDNPLPCHEAGVIALRIGRTKEGVNLLREALRRRASHQPTHAALARHYREAGPAHLAELHERLAKTP